MSNHEGNTLQLWCSEDMVRAMASLNEGMATSEAARVCNVPRDKLDANFMVGRR